MIILIAKDPLLGWPGASAAATPASTCVPSTITALSGRSP